MQNLYVTRVTMHNHGMTETPATLDDDITQQNAVPKEDTTK